jgi:hypothetical protein
MAIVDCSFSVLLVPSATAKEPSTGPMTTPRFVVADNQPKARVPVLRFGGIGHISLDDSDRAATGALYDA